MSSSQSEERTMVLTSEKKWYVQSEATKVSEFRAKISPFVGACSLQRLFADIWDFKIKRRGRQRERQKDDWLN